MSRLLRLKEESFEVFNKLFKDVESTNRSPILCYSGGKDSAALVGLYIEWKTITGLNIPDIEVRFSDTRLEAKALNKLVDQMSDHCAGHDLPFRKMASDLDNGFWIQIFGYGNLVPDYFIRWCTRMLKVAVMNDGANRSKNIINITGVHYGESESRDRKINKRCGSTECGIDLIEDSVEPIRNWRNCDVWDYLLMADLEGFIPKGYLNNLNDLYKNNVDENGSSRMGCAVCTVVGLASIKKNVELGINPEFTYEIRLLLEELRDSRRVLNPSGKLGAIFIDDRVRIWNIIKKQYLFGLIEHEWITQYEINRIDQMLADRTYLKTYPREHIEMVEKCPLTVEQYTVIKKKYKITLPTKKS